MPKPKRYGDIELSEVRNQEAEDSEDDAVYGVGSEENDSVDDESDESYAEPLSDLEDQKNDDDDDDLPNIRAWGKEKRNFYSTDYVDKDFGGFQGKDAELAEMEEKEAETLQQQLIQRMQDEDFSIPSSGKKIVEEKKSSTSKNQKRGTTTHESNIFLKILEDNEEKMKLRRKYLEPVLEQFKKGQLANSKAVEFVEAHNQLILNYSTNVYMCLHLKASEVDVQKHPIMKRLFQYYEFLSQMDPVFEDIIKPQIKNLMKKESGNDQAVQPTKKKEKEKKKNKRQEIMENPAKRVKFDEEADSPKVEEYHEDNNTEQVDPKGSNEKRAISYEIAKNKGLTPHRKKDQRNPRVRLKKKFRKAVIRRKGAIREPRTELTRYGGEASGIKTSVSKSVKIRT